jgi:glycosyltransferase involved in cell wall biosynthesis
VQPRPRILYINNSADLYGASRALLRVLAPLRERGFEPVVVVPERGPLQTRIEGLGMQVIVDPGLSIVDRASLKSSRAVGFFLGFPLSVLRFFNLLRRERIALVHTNTAVMPSPALAAWLAGVPHVWHMREIFDEFRSGWQIYWRYVHAFSTRIPCMSEAIAAQFPNRAKTCVLFDGLPLEEYPRATQNSRTGAKAKFQLGAEPVVGCVGRIKFVRKGQEVLVQAAALLKQRGLTAKYLLIGAPAPGNEEHGERLRKLIHDLGLGSDVVLPGELADPKPAYAAMDIFVLPSAQAEPFGLVVLEAMAMGCPVVATAIGGPLSIVAEGETGFLVPPGDARALADKLEVLLRDATLRERMAAAGRERLEAKFSFANTVNELEALYREVLSKPACPPQTSTR